MRSNLLSIFVTAMLIIIFAPSLRAQMSDVPSAQQENVQEPSTDKFFPKEVTFSYDSTDYTVSLTGLGVRKKLFFKVYGIAHYMDTPEMVGSKENAFKAVLADGKAKQITMDFARNVGADKIQGAYRDGFKKNSTDEEMKEIQSFVDEFVGYFNTEVKENEQYILRWLPGGTVLTVVKGEEKPAITSPTFARVLWTIWLGKDSIVDRDKLVKMMVSE
jgi:hypothetical protein